MQYRSLRRLSLGPVISLIGVLLLTGCKEELPIGPVVKLEGSRVGVHLSEVVDQLPDEDEVIAYSETQPKALVGRIGDFIPLDYRPNQLGGKTMSDLWTSQWDTEVFYDLETRIVFEIRARSRLPQWETNCRWQGDKWLRELRHTYRGKDVSVELESPPHGGVSVYPKDRKEVGGWEQQNYIIATCPAGYRLTPNQPTYYEVVLRNGALRRAAIGF